MASNNVDRYVILGVTKNQPDAVLHQAARFARHFDAVLVCANVDASSYVVQEHSDGSVTSRPIDPDGTDWTSTVFDDELAGRIRTLAGGEQVKVIFRELAGDVAHALGRLADVLAAEMIVVGSRRSGFKTSVHDFFGRSVAAHLAHRQPRPVVVIPLPVAPGDRLPKEELHP